ncbi:hypothetical protein GLX27_003022 [Malassezia furfur]|uniref:chitin deacetylase n=1 Tax=Malassezia furfur TaxID=55194 RepID=A0ABY8ERZ2_MALFU|nr:hypothetical protein CBS14141_002673 [Malassezia furfur]WFD48352.1 hypothetical protein GLX27_003022 [Malassezia furfur]
MLTPKLGALLFLAGASASVIRVAPHHAHERRAGAANAEEFSKITSVKEQCASYGDDTLTKMIQDNEFPKPNHIASILDNDEEARALYNEIKDNIPNIGVRQGTEDHSGFGDNDYPESDPDCWWSMSGCHQPKHPNVVRDVTECKEQDTWGLTFDDGPYCAHNKLYDFLKKENVRATMFYIGSYVLNNPYQAQRALVDGHDVCHHSWSHKLMTTLTNEQVFAELYYSGKVIKKVMGVTPLCWRPPQGDVDDRVRYIATALGMRTILWKEDTDDWNIQPAGSQPTQAIDENYRKIIGKAGSESPVVLSHEISMHTINEFIKMYPEIKKAYKNVAPVSVCTGVQKPYLENITYPSFSDYTAGQFNYQSLPSGTDIKVDANAEYKPVAFDQQDGGFGPNHKSAASQSSAVSSSGGASSSSSSASASGSSAREANQDNETSQKNQNNGALPARALSAWTLGLVMGSALWMA